MRHGHKILRKENDILSNLFPPTPPKSEVVKRERPANPNKDKSQPEKRGRKTTTTAATRKIDSPPHQSVSTPTRCRANINI